LVTGERGYCAAISKALKAAGYKVAAIMRAMMGGGQIQDGNRHPCLQMGRELFDACADGVKVEADLGPVDAHQNAHSTR
jgi:acetoacetyl-CoA reductase